MTAPLKALGSNVRAVDIATLVKPGQTELLCTICKTKPRAAGGKLSRCLDCLRTDVELERQQREARKAKHEDEAKTKVPSATKACRSCKIAKPLDSFAKHRLSRDGHRHDCRTCVKAGIRRHERSEAQREVDKHNAAQPHRRAANRAAVRAWSARNPMAARARRLLRQAVKAGKGQIAAHCPARGTNTERLQGHHHDYGSPLVVTWLCARHHRCANASGVLRLKEGVPRRRSRVPKTH